MQMEKNDFEQICNSIAGISPYVRFVGVIGESGELLAYKRRQDLVPLLDEKNTQYQFSHIAIKTDLEGFFDKNLGEIEFAWEERKKVQTMSRRREVAKRKIIADPIYGDKLVTKFTNSLMVSGKKAIAEGILYGAFDVIKTRLV